MAWYIQITFFAACLTSVSCQDPGCDYYNTIQPGVSVYVSSPNYPNNYTGGRTCRWIVKCPNAHCRADCYDISMPSSPQCSQDRLLISKIGSPQLQDPDTFCGSGTTTITSTGTDISFGLVTPSGSRGGRFSCRVTSIINVSSCSCGYKKTNRIVGGSDTGLNEYPMMVGLVNLAGTMYCGGTIIDKKYILTAGHCIPNNTAPSDITVVVGEHNIETNDSPATRRYRVSDYLVHSQYNPNNNDYDAALLLVSQDIEFSDRVGPVCLPFKFGANTFAGSKVTVLGWGTEFFGGPTATTLQKATLDVISDASCRQKENVTPRQICTYTPNKDTCQLDSGGPGMYTDPATGLLFHIFTISYGTFCGVNHPGVNTRVTAILPWIVQNTRDANYCMK